MTEFYCQRGDTIEGPFMPDELRYLVDRGKLAPGDRLREGQEGTWQPVSAFASFAAGSLSGNAVPATTRVRRRTTPPSEATWAAAELQARGTSSTEAGANSVFATVPPPAPLGRDSRKRRQAIVAAAAAIAILLLILWLFWPDEADRGAGTGAGGGGRSAKGAADGDGSGEERAGTEDASSTSQPARPSPDQTHPIGSGGQSRDAERRPPGDVIVTTPEGAIRPDRTDRFLIGGGEFFGIVAKGDSFVYVVDCSGSMAGEKFSAAREEVLRSTHNLLASQRFYVIFFSDGAYPMFIPAVAYPAPTPERVPLEADETNLHRLRDWVRGFTIQGGTDPREAMMQALHLRPDAIFMLTDGEFDASAVDLIRQQNRGRIAIHTIAFKDRSGESLLRHIADENGGEYRFVP